MTIALLKSFSAALLFTLSELSYAQTSPVIHIVAFGASQTEGKIVARKDAYPAQLERKLLAEGFNVSVRNAGVSGDTSWDMLKRIDRDVPENTQIVLFQPGTNDCGMKRYSSEAQFEETLSTILNYFKKNRQQVLVISGACHETIQADLPVKFGFKYYGKFGQGLADFPRPDGQHFTSEGYARFVELILPSVKELLSVAMENPIQK